MNSRDMKWNRAAAMALALLLSGCALAPVYQRPELPVPDAWPAGVAPARQADVPAAHNVGWEEFLRDAKARQVIQLALENNRDLRVAALNIERARALYRVQSAERLPHLDAGVNGLRQRTPGDLSASGDATLTSSYAVGIGTTAFELDFFGRVKNLSEAALERYIATDEARRSAHIALVAEVVTRYEAVAADRSLVELAQRTLESRADSYSRQRDLRDQGASSEYDLRQAESLLETARATLAQQTRQLALDTNALTLLTGRTVDASLLPDTGAIARGETVAAIPAGLPSDLIAARPDIRQREALLRAANANIGVARAAFFPRISLTGSLGTASSELSGLFASGSRSWSFLPQISLPIFDAGRNRANLNLATADRDIAVAQYEKAIQEAFREVADALAGTATLQDESRASTAQEQAELVRYELARQRYDSGYASYLELLDAQRALFAVQQKTILVGLAQLQNRIALYKALGGGWKSSSQR